MPNKSVWDKQFWGNLGQQASATAQEFGRATADKLQRFGNIPEEASIRAAELFPGDDARQNAMRHSLWMGRTAQELGGGELAQLATKLAGYGFETVTAGPRMAYHALQGDFPQASAIMADSRQDLNNNAVGIATAQYSPSAKHLEQTLKGMTDKIVTDDPKLYESRRPYLTRSAK